MGRCVGAVIRTVSAPYPDCDSRCQPEAKEWSVWCSYEDIYMLCSGFCSHQLPRTLKGGRAINWSASQVICLKEVTCDESGSSTHGALDHPLSSKFSHWLQKKSGIGFAERKPDAVIELEAYQPRAISTTQTSFSSLFPR